VVRWHLSDWWRGKCVVRYYYYYYYYYHYYYYYSYDSYYRYSLPSFDQRCHLPSANLFHDIDLIRTNHHHDIKK